MIYRPNSHFYFSFVLRRESVPKEKKIEERERERDGEEELERRATECTRSHQIFGCKLFFQSFQLQFQSSIFQILASHYLLYLYNLLTVCELC